MKDQKRPAGTKGVSGARNGWVDVLTAVFCFGPLVLEIAALAAMIAVLYWLFVHVLDITHFLNAQQKDAHENLNFLIVVVCLPLQTTLLLFGGLYGWWTLRQNVQFKQYDVERSCIAEYLDIEKQMRSAKEAGDTSERDAAVERYWVHMSVEFYSWRRRLVSRELFLSWSQFQVSELRQPDHFAGFQKHCLGRPDLYPKDSGFMQMMEYLCALSQGPKRPLGWFEIERFRYRLIGGPT